MSNIQYYKNDDITLFWKRIENFIEQRNRDYTISVSSNVMHLTKIEFPSMDIEMINSHIFPKNVGNIQRKIIFTDCSFNGSVTIKTTKNLNEIKFDTCTFEENILLSLRPTKSISINKCTFKKDLEFINIIINEPNKLFLFKNSEVHKSLRIVDCYLEYARFSNLKLQNSSIMISNTTLSNIKTNNITWSRNFNCDRDTFRQLKVVMEQHKNYIDANYFHSLELNEYRKELFHNEPIFHKFWEKTLFGLNWLISGFATSWIRPLLFLFIFSSLIYGVICYNHYLSTPCSVNGFFEFFNPLNRAANEDYKNIYWLWFLHKVISGFFLYHFIVALKKSSRF